MEYLKGNFMGFKFDGPRGEEVCVGAACGGCLKALKWLRDQDPPCPWEKTQCKDIASDNGHQHIVKWIDQREDESDVEYDGFSYDSNGVIRYW